MEAPIKGARARQPGCHYLELRYEDLIAEAEAGAAEGLRVHRARVRPGDARLPRASVRAPLGAVGPAGQGRQGPPGSERIAAHALTSEPPRADRVERWRTELTAEDIADYEDVAGELLADLGYPLAGTAVRVGVSSYWFNRGQGVVGRQLRSALESLGHETFVLARPTRDTNIRPSFVDDEGVWDQEG